MGASPMGLFFWRGKDPTCIGWENLGDLRLSEVTLPHPSAKELELDPRSPAPHHPIDHPDAKGACRAGVSPPPSTVQRTDSQ